MKVYDKPLNTRRVVYDITSNVICWDSEIISNYLSRVVRRNEKFIENKGIRCCERLAGVEGVATTY